MLTSSASRTSPSDAKIPARGSGSRICGRWTRTRLLREARATSGSDSAREPLPRLLSEFCRLRHRGDMTWSRFTSGHVRLRARLRVGGCIFVIRVLGLLALCLPAVHVPLRLGCAFCRIFYFHLCESSFRDRPIRSLRPLGSRKHSKISRDCYAAS